jgi:polyisoprenoid-binding protein YceI
MRPLLTMLLVLTLTSLVSANTYKLDPVHSSIVFSVKHLQVSHVFGRFNDPSGTFEFDPANPTAAKFDIQVQAASVDTGNERRDNHLRNPDFFEVDAHPVIRFVSTSITPKGEDEFEVTGDLSLHGVTRPLTITLRHTGTGPDQRGGQRSGFHTEFTINRSDFSMNFMIPAVSDEVRLIVALQGIRQ